MFSFIIRKIEIALIAAIATITMKKNLDMIVLYILLMWTIAGIDLLLNVTKKKRWKWGK